MSQLGVNVAWLITYVINIAVIFFILKKWAVKPVLGMLDRREEMIRQSVDQAHEIERRLAETRQECAAELDKARLEGQSIIAEAGKAAERLRAQVEAEARADAAHRLEQARAQIRQETDQAILQLRREVADLAILAAGRVVGTSLDQPQQRHLVAEFIEEAGKLN